jgi:hypothetical protein
MITTLQSMRHCPICGRPTLHIYDRHSCNHVLHYILTLFTGGLWIFIWLFAMFPKYTEPVCTICGGVKRDGDALSIAAFVILIPILIAGLFGFYIH